MLKLPLPEASHSLLIYQQKNAKAKLPVPKAVDAVSKEADSGELYAAFESEQVSLDESCDDDSQGWALKEAVVPAKVKANLMCFEDACNKVNSDSIQALAQHFNGELKSVRLVDSQDCLF